MTKTKQPSRLHQETLHFLVSGKIHKTGKSVVKYLPSIVFATTAVLASANGHTGAGWNVYD